MAPKRRNMVVGSVVKTKVLQETTAIVAAGHGPYNQKAAAPAVEELPASVNVSDGSRVVHVEVTTTDGGASAACVNVKQPKKRGRGGSKAAASRKDDEGNKSPPATEKEKETAVLLQSQKTQDPNEHEAAAAAEDADAKKRRQQGLEEADEEQPKTPRVVSDRKTEESQDSGGGDGEKKQQRRRPRRRLGAVAAGGDAGMGGMGGYKRYLWRVLKQVHPELGLSGRAMQVLDMMMADMFERLAGEAARLSKVTGRMTLTSREVQTAVRLVLPGELGKHAISEGVKAISKYTAA